MYKIKYLVFCENKTKRSDIGQMILWTQEIKALRTFSSGPHCIEFSTEFCLTKSEDRGITCLCRSSTNHKADLMRGTESISFSLTERDKFNLTWTDSNLYRSSDHWHYSMSAGRNSGNSGTGHFSPNNGYQEISDSNWWLISISNDQAIS